MSLVTKKYVIIRLLSRDKYLLWLSMLFLIFIFSSRETQVLWDLKADPGHLAKL